MATGRALFGIPTREFASVYCLNVRHSSRLFLQCSSPLINLPICRHFTRDSIENQDKSEGNIASSSKDTLDQKVSRRVAHVPLFTARRTGIQKKLKGRVEKNFNENDINYSNQENDLSRELEEFNRSDEELRKLTSRLRVKAQRGDLLGAVNLCIGIKMRMNALAKTKVLSQPEFPPSLVYHQLLKVASTQGKLDLCKEVLMDMQEANKNIGIVEKEWLLNAAVHKGDIDEIDIILGEIANISEKEDILSTPSDKDDSSINLSDHDQIISTRYVCNWTPKTFQIMLLHCQFTRNLEYALALLGAAGRRSKIEEDSLTLGSENQGTVPMLARVLDANTAKSLLHLARECRQARLMADLALWMDEGAAMRKLDRSLWMDLLRFCADEHWFPGVELGWDRAITRGLLHPDEGLIISVLNCASRTKNVQFIENVLKTYQNLSRTQNSLREWHLLPLLESQCLAFDYEGAIRTVTRLANVSRVKASSSRLWTLVSVGSTSKNTSRLFYNAFVTVGRDVGEQGGVTTEAINALIRLANKMGMHEMALKIYGIRSFVRNEEYKADIELPKLPTFYQELSVDASEVGEAGREAVRQIITQIRDIITINTNEINQNSRAPVANTTTYNYLLQTAIDLESRELGQFVFSEINRFKIAPDSTTYERSIILALTQENYEDSFPLLEECKSHGFKPTRATYLALSLRCWKENDDRWIAVGKEMIENGHFPSKVVRTALLEGGWITEDSLDAINPYNSSN